MCGRMARSDDEMAAGDPPTTTCGGAGRCSPLAMESPDVASPRQPWPRRRLPQPPVGPRHPAGQDHRQPSRPRRGRLGRSAAAPAASSPGRAAAQFAATPRRRVRGFGTARSGRPGLGRQNRPGRDAPASHRGDHGGARRPRCASLHRPKPGRCHERHSQVTTTSRRPARGAAAAPPCRARANHGSNLTLH
jgi:hypothetical protein